MTCCCHAHRRCLVYDFGSRNKKRGVPRALWYGTEFIRYALNLAWYETEGDAFLRGYGVKAQFRKHYDAFAKPTRRYVACTAHLLAAALLYAVGLLDGPLL